MKKHWAAVGPRNIAGKTYSAAQIVDRLQSILDSIKATSSTYAAWRAQVAKQRNLERQMRDFVRILEIAIRSECGDNAVQLAWFGLEPPKKTGPRTVKAKQEMVSKAKATRIARHTMGKRQRLKVRGKPPP